MSRDEYRSPYEQDRVNSNLLAGEAGKSVEPTKDDLFMRWFVDSGMPWVNMGLVYKSWLAGRKSVKDL